MLGINWEMINQSNKNFSKILITSDEPNSSFSSSAEPDSIVTELH